MPTRELTMDEMQLVLGEMEAAPHRFFGLNVEHLTLHLRLDALRQEEESLREKLRQVELRMLSVAKD